MKTGDALAPLERTIGLPRMIAYAGATWDWHRMHYDADHARAAGLHAPVVDGQMLGALLAEQLGGHFGPRSFLRELAFRFTSMVFAGDTVRCEGEIVTIDAGAVGTSHRVLVRGPSESAEAERLAAVGTALVKPG